MFDQLEEINSRPKPFEFYTAEKLWTDEYTSKKMLDYHLNDDSCGSPDVSGFLIGRLFLHFGHSLFINLGTFIRL